MIVEPVCVNIGIGSTSICDTLKCVMCKNFIEN